MKILRVLMSTLSIMLALPAAAHQEPDWELQEPQSQEPIVSTTRGLVNASNIFMPKGLWSVGGSISYSTHNNDGYQLLVVEGINSAGYSFKVSPLVTYTYADNQAVGVRFIYDRSLLRINDATLTFGDDQTGVTLLVEDFYSLSHSYLAQAVLRQYIPVGSSKRFALFNEIHLGVGGSQSKFAYDSPVTGTFSRSHDYSLGLTPGVVAFVADGITLEVSVGVLGLSYKDIEQVHNQVTVGGIQNKSMNFKINLFSIGFGVGFNI